MELTCKKTDYGTSELNKSFKNESENDIKGFMTDGEKPSKARIDPMVKNLESRNNSIDRIREETEKSFDKQTEKLKDKIRKNLEAMRISQSKDNNSQTRNNQRTITPMKSRNQSNLDIKRKDLAMTEQAHKKEEDGSNKK